VLHSFMSTFESRYCEVIESFKQRSQLQEHIKELEFQLSQTREENKEYANLRHVYQEAVDQLRAYPAENEIDYMLEVIPYIREYAEDKVVEEEDTELNPTKTGKDGTMQGFVTVTQTNKRHEVFHNYLVSVEKRIDHLPKHCKKVATQSEDEYLCSSCNISKVLNGRESTLVCPGCGCAEPYMEMNQNGLTYEETTNRGSISWFSYKRCNHFAEWLLTLQAKEETTIPEEVLDAVRAEYKKSRFTVKIQNHITPPKTRQFLKKLGLNKYYEHTQAITSILSGVPAPKLSPPLEKKLKQLFMEIQEPFERHKPANRSNFLSYSFILYKFCELLGEDSLLQYFPLLKSTEKLFACDQVWKKICLELGWEFIPSL